MGEEDDLIHADASPALSQNGQQTSVQTGKTPSIDTPEEAALAKWVYTIFTVCGVAREARHEFLERLQAFKEAAADAVIEECAKIAEQRRDELADMQEAAEGPGAGLVFTGGCMAAASIADRIRALKASSGRVVDRNAPGCDGSNPKGEEPDA